MITITFAGWMIPLLITFISVGYVVFIYDEGGGMFSGLMNLFLLIPALGISLIAWIGYVIWISIRA